MQQDKHSELPETGDVMRCEECGMELRVTKDCHCTVGSPVFECCGKPLLLEV